MKRDTLLMITTSYPQAGDGSEAAGAFVADFAVGMAAHIPVRVVAPGLRAGREERDGVEIYRFASPGRPLSLLTPSRPADWPVIVSTLWSMRAQAVAASRDGKVGHTLAFWALPCGWVARGLQRRAGIDYSVWALGSDIWSLGKVPIARSILRRVIRDARQRFADGLELGREAERIGGKTFEFLPSARRLVLPRSRAVAERPPYRLVFLGRWHPNKGVDLLMGALSRLSDADWERIEEVHVAGGGPLEELVKTSVAHLQEQGRPLRLSSYLGNREACEALASADYLLLPSRIESIPVIFSDALKMRLPIVAMPVGDLPTLFGEFRVGELAGAVDVAQFAAALSMALRGSPRDYAQGIASLVPRFEWAFERLGEEFALHGVE